MKRRRSGFTLLELAIAVGLVAILAAIALPGFLRAQVRSKASEVRSDMRTVALAIESYAADHDRVPRMAHTGHYPEDVMDYPPGEYPGGVYAILWKGLSTPVAYLSRVNLIDPFQTGNDAAPYDERVYTYQDLPAYTEWYISAYWQGALDFYGKWRLGSVGPDQVYSHGFPTSSQIAYDPTNGTVSLGNIWRSQRYSKNVQPIDGGVLLFPH